MESNQRPEFCRLLPNHLAKGAEIGCFRYPSFPFRDRGSLANAHRMRVAATIPLIAVSHLLLSSVGSDYLDSDSRAFRFLFQKKVEGGGVEPLIHIHEP